MSHTPGPWEAKGWSGLRDCSLIMKGSHAIAGAFYLGGTEPAHDNARLIAAAPDMLAALLDVDCPSGGWTGSDENGHRPQVKDCLADKSCGCIYGDAVKKATEAA